MVALASAHCLLGACAKQPQTAAASAAAQPAGKTGTTEAVNPCSLLKDDDVRGILSAPIASVANIPGDTQSCSFNTAGFASITISVRPGLGRTTVNTWLSGKMPVPATALAGVGDSAAWQPDLHEVIAQRNDLLCDIQADGLSRDLRDAPETLQRKLGALCDRIFTRYVPQSRG